MTPIRTVLLTLPLLLGVACDDKSLADGEPPCDPGSVGPEPHPYTSCSGPDEVDPEPYHHACEAGCGYAGDENAGRMVCAIPCSTDADCGPWEGDGSALTQCLDGRCYYLCDDEQYHCPSDLECYDRGDLYEPDALWGECMAPWPANP